MEPAVYGTPAARVERRRDRWIAALRYTWVVVTLLTVSIIAIGSVLRYHEQRQVCGAPTEVCLMGQRLTPENLAGVADADAAVRFHALFFVIYTSTVRASCWVLALLLFWRKSDDLVALLLALYLLTVGNPGPLFSAAAAFPILWPTIVVLQILSTLCFGLFFCLFPNGHFVPGWSRWLALVWCVNAVASPFVMFPRGVPLWWVLGVLAPLYGVSVYAQIERYRKASNAVERQQTKWVIFSIVLWLVLIIGVRLSTVFGPPLDAPISAIFYFQVIGFGLAVLALPLGLSIAILRYHLFDIDLIINRTLVYGLLTASVAGLYVLIVSALGTLLQAQGSFAIALLATGIVAVLFQPLRGRLQRSVDRLFYGERDEPYRVIARLGQRLEAAFDPSAILPAVVQTVGESLRLPYVAIALDGSGHGAIAAATGTPPAAPLRFPLSYQGDVLGQLLVSPRRGEPTLALADRRLLADLAQQAGAAVHGVRLMADLQRVNADLRRSREQLILAREEERRRLRRDLHDDLAPTLAGLALTARTIHDLIPDDPAKAAALAGDLYTTTRDAVGTIRRLVYDLRPPELDELGLLPAIRARATQYSGSRGGANELRVVVEGPDTLPPLPAAVEVAAYRIVQEALMNVAKHAQARTCNIRLALADALQIEIADDGVGLSDACSPGVGLRSMHERAAELGGTCEIGSMVGGGTRIGIRLPVKNEAEHEPAAHPDR